MVIYHPPPSSKNNTTTSMFIDEITNLLTNIVPKYLNLIILGDFNISTENVSNPDTVIFSDTMAALGSSTACSGTNSQNWIHIGSNLLSTGNKVQGNWHSHPWFCVRSLHGVNRAIT